MQGDVSDLRATASNDHLPEKGRTCDACIVEAHQRGFKQVIGAIPRLRMFASIAM